MIQSILTIGINWWPEEINFFPSLSAVIGFILVVMGTMWYLRRFIRIYALRVARDMLWKNWVTGEIQMTNLMLTNIVKIMPEGHRTLLVDYMKAQIKNIPMTSNPVYKEQSVMKNFYNELGCGDPIEPTITEEELAKSVLKGEEELHLTFEHESPLTKFFNDLGLADDDSDNEPKSL